MEEWGSGGRREWEKLPCFPHPPAPLSKGEGEADACLLARDYEQWLEHQPGGLGWPVPLFLGEGLGVRVEWEKLPPQSGRKNFSRRKSPHGLGRKTSAEGSLPTVWAKKLQPKEVSPRAGEKNFSRRKSPHGLGRKTSAAGRKVVKY